MFALVFATFSAAYLMMGADRAFQPGNYQPTLLWIVISIVLGFVAAFVGGLVAVKVGRGSGGARLLAIVVLILGIAMAIPQLMSKADPGPRTGPVSNNDAMQKSQSPVWVTLLNPLIGCAGVLSAARRARA
jgi:hypothetical protein